MHGDGRIDHQELQDTVASASPKAASDPQSLLNQALWHAAEQHNLSHIMQCLSRGANINIRGWHNRTILMHMVLSDRSDLALALMNAGASLDPQDDDGETALMMALHKNDARTAKRLIESGADILIENKNGQKAIDIALRSKDPAIALLFESALKELIHRIPQGHLVWRHPVSARERDPHGDTILTWAARHGQENVVRALVASGVDPLQVNAEGLTAAQVARVSGHRRIESLLKTSAKEDKK